MKRHLFKILLVISLIAGNTATVSAEQTSPGEYLVKALFLYNFFKFVEWPRESSFSTSPSVNVCIIGDDPFGHSLDEIRDETVRGKKLEIRFVSTPEEGRKCQLLFIPASERYRAGQIARTVRDSGVLTVSDSPDPTREGVVIGFYMEQKKVRFAINIDAAKRSNLKISAQLLKLARIVKSEE